jgi:hypothetical protein
MSMLAAAEDYRFESGFPTPETAQRAYDDADLVRAITAYRFFYPSVSAFMIYKGNIDSGMVANRVSAIVENAVGLRCFTPNSDTPYGGLMLDVSDGPMVIELPAGALMGTVNDLNQRWVLDMGLPGPDGGQGGKHLLLSPGYDGELPEGFYTGTPTTNRMIGLLRALPPGGDLQTGIALMKTAKVYPLHPPPGWREASWAGLSHEHDFSPDPLENDLEYWHVLHELIDSEPPYEGYRNEYGELAALGILKGHPFEPDQRMKEILVRAAQSANAQMRVQSFADRRPDRVVWEGTRWEWAVLRPENGTFDAEGYADLEARDKWFYQAQIESPAMFARAPGAGSLYWLCARDHSGAYLDGGHSYTLSVPLPVPGRLFWSITVYDAETRAEIVTDQNLAALRSLVELPPDKLGDASTVDLYFGPEQPDGSAGRWIKTLRDRGWFVYFRIYAPEGPAFDGSWRLPDFERLDSVDDS